MNFKEILQFKEELKLKILYDPQDVKALILLGTLECIKFPERENAIQHLKRAVLLDSKNTEARFWLSVCLFRYFHNNEKALQVAGEALALDPNRADCLSIMAYLLWNKEEPLLEESLAYLKAAIKISPDWPMLRIEMIFLLLNLGRVEEASQELKDASSLINQAVRTPKDVIESYYENYVTGRSWADLEERLERIKPYLVQAKSFQSNDK